ncbi:hypothetical protein K5I29_08700 [Flavobacterium agricola]|uniref:PH domain-containing protein n=1 Tax=Flavobacterium agricola TaxID=2870839 RepID=A0ABY6LXB5_9FLAO|nr:hypothetical protein [Flavobacterium agricola]UYW00617.1 hypothetical protein K5I29_08700 [Flavobacterium agricola]
MYSKIKSGKFTFKITDLLGILVLVHPLYLLFLKFPLNVLFYLQIIASIFLLSQNLFGLTGYAVKLTKVHVIFYEEFFPHYVKIKNIVDIEKDFNKITLKTIDQKVYHVYFDKVAKKQRYKTNDFYYDIHNRIYAKTLKV